VNWILRADDGGDVITRIGERLDVKTTFPHYKLIWSNTINHLFEGKDFHHLVAVSMIKGAWDRAWVEGFLPKREFYAQKRIADGRSGLEAGTWWVEKSECYDAKLLCYPEPVRWKIFRYAVGCGDRWTGGPSSAIEAARSRWA
jgi:hypothetical protein